MHETNYFTARDIAHTLSHPTQRVLTIQHTDTCGEQDAYAGWVQLASNDTECYRSFSSACCTGELADFSWQLE